MGYYFIVAVSEYYQIVHKACMDFISYIQDENPSGISCKSELLTYVNRNKNTERYVYAVGDKQFVFHGSGCSVLIDEKPYIEWDFGVGSFWCGVEPYKMAHTLQNCGYGDKRYYDQEIIKEECEENVRSSLMYKSAGQYYFNLIKLETIEYKFPEDYDFVIIQSRSGQKRIPRSKALDRFIRKSTVVYKYIDRLEENSILIFVDNGEEKGRFLYNADAYPKAAVSIMNDILTQE